MVSSLNKKIDCGPIHLEYGQCLKELRVQALAHLSNSAIMKISEYNLVCMLLVRFVFVNGAHKQLIVNFMSTVTQTQCFRSQDRLDLYY